MRFASCALFSAMAALASACSPAPAPSANSTAPPSAVAANPNGIEVTAPLANARVIGPVRVTGVAPNDWYFEGVFDAKLIGADGAVLAEAPATGQTAWTTPGPVPFIAEFTVSVAKDQTATIVLTEDATGEKPKLREVRIPITLAAP
jgi:Immunoglobulin-like domain of bacterial spore germination